jgi:hypothetical protein
MDGGTVWNTNLVSAVQRCRDLGVADKDIVMDIINCDHPTLGAWDNRDETVSNFMRYRSLKSYYSGIADIYDFKAAFPEVHFRYYA